MHRFFVLKNNISENKIVISEPRQIHHLKDVLRLKFNDAICVFDEDSNEYVCLIQSFKPRIMLEIKKRIKIPPASKKINLSVACALPKNSNMDDIVDKLTQLGIDRIIPLKTGRVIVKLDAKKQDLRLRRWVRIAQSAAQQSQRVNLPVIEPIKDMDEVLAESGDYDLKLIPTLSKERKTLKEVLKDARLRNILVLIGPEGDFTDEEVAMAVKSGCVPVSLGKQVLRVETAAVSVVSFIMLYGNS